MSQKIVCQECGATLTGKVIWLELDQDTNKFYYNKIPEGHNSQGLFPFGRDCAKKVRSD